MKGFQVATSLSPLPGFILTLRHFIGGLLAFASLNRACWDLVPAFPQRSPPWYLATAACGGLRSAHDCRPRRALLHHSHSWAPPIRRRRFRVTRPFSDMGNARRLRHGRLTINPRKTTFFVRLVRPAACALRGMVNVSQLFKAFARTTGQKRKPLAP